MAVKANLVFAIKRANPSFAKVGDDELLNIKTQKVIYQNYEFWLECQIS